MSDYQEFPPESTDDTPLVYYFPSYFSLQETVTSAKINSLIKCYNTLIEKFMQHNHTEGLNAYDEKTRAVKLAACACLVDGSIHTKCLANDCVTDEKIDTLDYKKVFIDLNNNYFLDDKITEISLQIQKLWNNLILGTFFSQEVATAIGGYPQGAVLDYITGEGYRIKIKSLINNNTNAPTDTNIKNPSVDPSRISYWEDITTNMPVVFVKNSVWGGEHITLKPNDNNRVGNIEMYGGSNVNYGGHIDFHFKGSSEDFTSRICEDEYRELNLVCANGLKVNGYKQRCVIEKSTFSDAENFYVIYDDGWVEQGGYVIGNPGWDRTYRNVIFQIPMANSIYNITLTVLNSNHAMSEAFIGNKNGDGATTTGLIVNTVCQNGGDAKWVSWCVRGWKA